MRVSYFVLYSHMWWNCSAWELLSESLLTLIHSVYWSCKQSSASGTLCETEFEFGIKEQHMTMASQYALPCSLVLFDLHISRSFLSVFPFLWPSRASILNPLTSRISLSQPVERDVSAFHFQSFHHTRTVTMYYEMWFLLIKRLFAASALVDNASLIIREHFHSVRLQLICDDQTALNQLAR